MNYLGDHYLQLPDFPAQLSTAFPYIELYIIQFICILESQVVELLDGDLLYTKILEVNLFAFAYRLFHRDFSPINGTYCNISR